MPVGAVNASSKTARNGLKEGDVFAFAELTDVSGLGKDELNSLLLDRSASKPLPVVVFREGSCLDSISPSRTTHFALLSI
jgi:hypothetical protein